MSASSGKKRPWGRGVLSLRHQPRATTVHNSAGAAWNAAARRWTVSASFTALPYRRMAEAALARAQDFPGTGYGLVTTFDCLHDMGDPVGAARHIRAALADDGSWLIVEPYAGGSVAQNLTPVGRVYYNFSTFLCVPHAISEGAADALGNQAGEAPVGKIVSEAGFGTFRRVAETPFNLVYEARP